MGSLCSKKNENIPGGVPAHNGEKNQADRNTEGLDAVDMPCVRRHSSGGGGSFTGTGSMESDKNDLLDDFLGKLKRGTKITIGVFKQFIEHE